MGENGFGRFAVSAAGTAVRLPFATGALRWLLCFFRLTAQRKWAGEGKCKYTLPGERRIAAGKASCERHSKHKTYGMMGRTAQKNAGEQPLLSGREAAILRGALPLHCRERPATGKQNASAALLDADAMALFRRRVFLGFCIFPGMARSMGALSCGRHGEDCDASARFAGMGIFFLLYFVRMVWPSSQTDSKSFLKFLTASSMEAMPSAALITSGPTVALCAPAA